MRSGFGCGVLLTDTFYVLLTLALLELEVNHAGRLAGLVVVRKVLFGFGLNKRVLGEGDFFVCHVFLVVR